MELCTTATSLTHSYPRECTRRLVLVSWKCVSGSVLNDCGKNLADLTHHSHFFPCGARIGHGDMPSLYAWCGHPISRHYLAWSSWTGRHNHQKDMAEKEKSIVFNEQITCNRLYLLEQTCKCKRKIQFTFNYLYLLFPNLLNLFFHPPAWYSWLVNWAARLMK